MTISKARLLRALCSKCNAYQWMAMIHQRISPARWGGLPCSDDSDWPLADALDGSSRGLSSPCPTASNLQPPLYFFFYYLNFDLICRGSILCDLARPRELTSGVCTSATREIRMCGAVLAVRGWPYSTVQQCHSCTTGD